MKKWLFLSILLFFTIFSNIMSNSLKDSLEICCIGSKSSGIIVQYIKTDLVLKTKLDSLAGQKMQVVFKLNVEKNGIDSINLNDLKYFVIFNKDHNKSLIVFNKKSYKVEDFYNFNEIEISQLYDELKLLIFNYLLINKVFFSSECDPVIDVDFKIFINFI